MNLVAFLLALTIAAYAQAMVRRLNQRLFN